MASITPKAGLTNAIQQLEEKQAAEWLLLKEQLLVTRESLQPLNLLKNTFKDVLSSHELKNNIMGTAVGLTAGYLSKALIVGATHNPITKLFGALLQSKVSTLATNNSGTIATLAGNLVHFFSKKKEAKAEKPE